MEFTKSHGYLASYELNDTLFHSLMSPYKAREVSAFKILHKIVYSVFTHKHTLNLRDERVRNSAQDIFLYLQAI